MDDYNVHTCVTLGLTSRRASRWRPSIIISMLLTWFSLLDSLLDSVQHPSWPSADVRGSCPVCWLLLFVLFVIGVPVFAGMVDTKLVSQWFPALLTSSETTVPELAVLLAGFAQRQVIEGICPGLSKVAKQPEQVRLHLCKRIRHVFALDSARLGIQYCQTVVAVVVVWCTANGTSVRRNLVLSRMLAAFTSIHGLLLTLSSKHVSLIRVFARAFRTELQLLTLSGVLPVNAPILQKLLQFVLMCVFSPDYAESMSYIAFMRYCEDTYVGFCKARRTLSRCRDAPGFAVRVTERLIGCRGLGKGRDAERYWKWQLLLVESLAFAPKAIGSTDAMRAYECRGIREIRPGTQLREHRSLRGRATRRPFFLFPRFRSRPDTTREPELNIAVR